MLTIKLTPAQRAKLTDLVVKAHAHAEQCSRDTTPLQQAIHEHEAYVWREICFELNERAQGDAT